MKAKSKARNRLIAMLLVVAMAVMLIPAETYAYLGAARQLSDEDWAAIHSGTVRKSNGDTYAYVENDYIYFEVLINSSSNRDKVGRMAHTVSQAMMKSKSADLSGFGTQMIHYTTNKAVKNDALIQNKEWSEIKNLTLEEYSVDDGAIWLGMSAGSGKYQFNANFSLFSLDYGDPEATRFPEYLDTDPDDTTQNWAVFTECQIMGDDEDEFIEDPYARTWEVPKMVRKYTVARLELEFQHFPKMGHANADEGIPTVRAQM